MYYYFTAIFLKKPIPKIDHSHKYFRKPSYDTLRQRWSVSSCQVVLALTEVIFSLFRVGNSDEAYIFLVFIFFVRVCHPRIKNFSFLFLLALSGIDKAFLCLFLLFYFVRGWQPRRKKFKFFLSLFFFQTKK